jgi:N-acetylmuramoyl-L-alanine amidase
MCASSAAQPSAESAALSDATTGALGSGDYVVQPGDCLTSIAARHGHFWQTLWELPANAELRAARVDPNVLLPGDRVTIPSIQVKQSECATGRKYVFRRRGVPAFLRLQFFHGGEPRARVPYTISVDGRELPAGDLDAEGRLCVAIPCNAALARIVVGSGTHAKRHTVRLGRLDPVTELTGLQARLNNLGFMCGPVDGWPGPRTVAAIRAFRRAQGLEEQGCADAAVRSRLLALHGG